MSPEEKEQICMAVATDSDPGSILTVQERAEVMHVLWDVYGIDPRTNPNTHRIRHL
jgi:hypothetical protein